MSTFKPDDAILVIFENGKGVRIPLELYQTKSVRKKLTNVYSTKSKAVAAFYLNGTKDIVLRNNQNKAICISSALVPLVATRGAGGNTLFTVKPPNSMIVGAEEAASGLYENAELYRKRKVPATGNAMTPRDIEFFSERIHRE